MYWRFLCGIVYLRLDQEWLEEVTSLFSIGIIERKVFNMKSTYTFMKELVEKISNPRKRYVIITTNGIKNIVDEKYYNAITEELEDIECAVFLYCVFNLESFNIICDENDKNFISHKYAELKYDI